MASIELVCPAGSPAMLEAAIEAGADSVYCGLRDETNARNFPGLNFDAAELTRAVAFAHRKGAKVLVAINTFARAGGEDRWRASVATALEAGADAIIAADLAVLAHVRKLSSTVRLHLSVQAAANTPEAISFYVNTFGVRRVVVPRVMSAAEIGELVKEAPAEIEAFVFGGLCVMTEGRCALSSYVSGQSPNLSGVCSPPQAVSFERTPEGMVSRLAGLALDKTPSGGTTGYPTLCKGRFSTDGDATYLFEEPTSLNAMGLLASLRDAGVKAVKIEGRQRGKAYVARVTRAFRKAIDALDRGGSTAPYEHLLTDLAEGGRETEGAYNKRWR